MCPAYPADRDSQALAERLLVCVPLDVLIAACPVGAGGDVELAGVGGEVQDLAAREQPRVGG